MTTVTVWLLVFVSQGYYNAGTVTIGPKFKTVEECQRVLELTNKIGRAQSNGRCIQTMIVTP